jgi:hypothetical protein
VVAYLTDGRFKAPTDATVEIIPGETLTKSAEPEPGTTPAAVPGNGANRRPLPPAAGPQ